MNQITAQYLTRLTNEFYATVSESFNATRTQAWPGWERIIDETAFGRASREQLSVLDLACGNLRFEQFLLEKLPECSLAVTCVDGRSTAEAEKKTRAAMNTNQLTITPVQCDIMEKLSKNDALEELLGTCYYDLAVCFGFMHHLPLKQQRKALLSALVRSTKPGGFVALSFWQLSKSDALLKKAQYVSALKSAELEIEGLADGDYLLGWQDRCDVVRYCHDYSDQEIDLLVSNLEEAREVCRFSADGRTSNLNCYVVLQRV